MPARRTPRRIRPFTGPIIPASPAQRRSARRGPSCRSAARHRDALISHAGSGAIIFGMSDEDKPRSFEEALRAIADEVVRGLDRVQRAIWRTSPASTASTPSAPSASWTTPATGCARRPTRSTPTARSAPATRRPSRVRPSPPTTSWDDDPLRHAGPDPLDTPTDDQGRALAALDSGRWTVEPGTSALSSTASGPGPSDALGPGARAARARLDRRRRRGHARRARRAAALARHRLRLRRQHGPPRPGRGGPFRPRP